MTATVTDIAAEQFQRAASGDWPDPADLAAVPDQAPYPAEAFPEIAQRAITEYAEIGQQPLALIGNAALGQMALAAQPLANVARDPQLTGPISLNLITVAKSGERKTAADRLFGRAVRGWQERERDARMLEHRKSAAMAAEWRARIEGTKTKIKTLSGKVDDAQAESDLRSLRNRLIELEQNPILTIPLPQLDYEDVNPASLSYALATGWPSAGLYSDEGGLVIGSQGLSDDSATSLLSLLNILWDGRSYIPTRKAAQTAPLRDRRFSCALMIQGDLLPKLIEKGARDLGFLARFLIAAPQTTMGLRLYREPPADWHAINAFGQRIMQLLELDLPLDRSGEDRGLAFRLAPPTMKLDPNAKALWREWHDLVEAQLKPFGELTNIDDIASKNAENAARIAAVFQIFERGKPSPWLEQDAMERAIHLASWYLMEARRVFLEADAPQELQDALVLSEWLTGRARDITDKGGAPIINPFDNSIAMRDIARLGPGRLRKDRDRRVNAIDALIEANHLRPCDSERPRHLEINPKLLTNK